jgi:hypothetical protein
MSVTDKVLLYMNLMACVSAGILNISFFVRWVKLDPGDSDPLEISPRVRQIKSWTRLITGVMVILFGVIYFHTAMGILPGATFTVFLRPLLFLVMVALCTDVILDW